MAFGVTDLSFLPLPFFSEENKRNNIALVVRPVWDLLPTRPCSHWKCLGFSIAEWLWFPKLPMRMFADCGSN